MTLMRWDPFRELASLEGRLNRMFADAPSHVDDSYGRWSPAVDIFEKGDELVIRAELPGVSSDDIEINVENNTMILRGERKRDVEVEDENSYRNERVFGSFTRSFSLPTTVDPARIAATQKDGVLQIVLPKIEAAKPRKIAIEAA